MKNFFFVKSRLIISLYSNTEQKGRYTGWVERVVILGSIHDPKLMDLKNTPILRIHRINCGSNTTIETFKLFSLRFCIEILYI